jgi:hypothetical protein
MSNVGGDVEKLDHSHIFGKKLVHIFQKTVHQFLKKIQYYHMNPTTAVI